MRDVIYLLLHLLTTLDKLIGPGSGRTVIAENLILKQQLIIDAIVEMKRRNASAWTR